MFRREHHQRIERVLRALNGPFLADSGCYFGGGTAIVLLLGEYRESSDIDLLCSSSSGYRQVLNAIWESGIQGIFREPVKTVREVKRDRDAIRTFLDVDGIAIKFEIVREARIELEGNSDPALPIATLSRVDMYAEKLLANADRGDDKAMMSRDVIDLAVMIEHWGPIPDQAWVKVTAAYGKQAFEAFERSRAKANDPAYLQECLQKMHMDPAWQDRIRRSLASVERLDVR